MPDAPRNRLLIPLAAGAAIVALVASGAYLGHITEPDNEPQARAQPGWVRNTPSPSPTPTKIATKPIAQLQKTDLSRAETAKFEAACASIETTEQEGPRLADFDRTLAAFSVDAPGLAQTDVTAWLVKGRGNAREGRDIAMCTRLHDGTVATVETGIQTMGPSGAPRPIYQIVGGELPGGSGLYTDPVARVTLEPKNGVETDAVLAGGMWFYPEPSGYGGDPDDFEKGPQPELIGLQDHLFRYRAYDRNGRQVYDSAKDGPSASDCYTDPAGKEIITVNSVKQPTLETCHRTYWWKARW